MMRNGFLAFFFLALAFLLISSGLPEDKTQAQPAGRLQAQKLMEQGNFKEAFDLFSRLVLEKSGVAGQVRLNLKDGANCLRRLGRQKELDAFIEKAVKVHPGSWRCLFGAAEAYFSGPNWGYIVGGEFQRGQHRGRARRVSSYERDRTRGLQLMVQAMEPAKSATDRQGVSDMYWYLARMLMGRRGHQESWRLQNLSDLKTLPDHETFTYGYRGYGGGAPVDGEGNPVFHKCPARWQTAKTDGERWRFALLQAMEFNAHRRAAVLRHLADFCYNQFGVQTLASYGWHFNRIKDDDTQASIFSLHTLGDGETIAKLATGIKRFNLPAEFNYIKIYEQLGAWRNLGGIYENRQQYPKALTCWERAGKPERVAQIKKNWGMFEGVATQSAGQGAALQFRFRNGKKVQFTAKAIDMERLLADIKTMLQANPKKVPWNQVNISNLGHELVKGNRKKYVGGQVASWNLELQPRAKHFDKRITVTTPLQKAGAYLLEAKMDGGNTSFIVVWVADTVVVKKPLAGKTYYYIADSRTGAPVAQANVEFFGYRREYKRNWIGRGGRYNVKTRNFAEYSDGAGQVVLDPNRQPSGYRWMIIARTDAGRMAYLGFTNVWHSKYYDKQYNQQKIFGITDRPVYRPGQAVKFKFWLNQAQYDREGKSPFAGLNVTLRLNDPQNRKLIEKKFKTDDYGGITGEFPLKKGCKLGQYYLHLPYQDSAAGRIRSRGVRFRVEEYKKPEFEVKISAPDEPVKLGEKITAKVQAKYYFGAPVTKAKVKIKVLRTSYSADWYPSSHWDWFYGSGYWWFGYDYGWYPGWKRWGCPRPSPWWWSRQSQQPEVVAELEVPIGKDGTVSVPIDTAIAKELYPNSDHKYAITAEVCDESRRTIVGAGNVLVARKPFKVYAWVDQGHYGVGEVVQASFNARRLDGKGVKGKGKVKLFQVAYKAGEPVETLVREWDLATDAGGSSHLQLKASTAGQYRLSYSVTDTKNHVEEGAHLFCVVGTGDDGRDYRFSHLELVADKKEYQPGDKVRLKVNTDRRGSTVLLFVRASNGVYLMPKQLRLAGKTHLEEIPVGKKDMPNFFVEALTISGGQVYTEIRQIVVPPESRILKVQVTPSAEKYKPGAPATMKIKLVDRTGEPYAGTAVVTMYDKAVEYISGGSNVGDIKAFFWKWKRSHRPNTQHSLSKSGYNLALHKAMSFLGVFGAVVADMQPEEEMQDSSPAPPRGAPTSPGAPGGLRRKQKGGRAEGKKSESAGRDRGFLGDMSLGKPMAVTAEAGAGSPKVEPKVRTKFADTALWVGAITTGKDGMAEVKLTMPENLTTWKTRVWAMGGGARCGEGTASVVTTKNLLLRLQAPRFFVQKDEVVLSANVHNYLPEKKQVDVVLELDGPTIGILSVAAKQTVEIEPGGEMRVDWRVKVLKPGQAIVRMKALSDTESDAMQVAFPVMIHGMLKTESFCGVIRPEQSGSTIKLTVPTERLPEQSRLEIRYSPTLAAAMVDSLPYLVSYPYGCTEQTLNRFIPTVITQKVLQRMGVDLGAIKAKRTNLNAQEIGDGVKRAKGWRRWKHNPVFDEAKVKEMVQAGLERLGAMQCSDGGWGWFSGHGERSWPHTTATVVHGLQIARANDVAVVPSMLNRGIAWLKRYQARELQKIKNGRLETKVRPWKSYPGNLDAFVYMVLVDEKFDNKEMLSFLYEDRNRLAVYTKAMLGMTCHQVGEVAKRDMLTRNVEQYLRQDDENQTAWLELPNSGYWWNWYGSEYEAQAYYLKLLAVTKPKSVVASRLVKYLLNNRKHATYWKSTRDTALCVEAFADYLKATGEDKPDQTVRIMLDGKQVKEVKIDGANLFTFDNKFVLAGTALTGGAHKVEFVKTGRGPLYYNAYLTNFTLEDGITAAGLEIKVARNYYKLVKVAKTVKDRALRGQVVDKKVEKYERVPLANMAMLKSGDLVEIELVIESKNDYEYIMFEDMKAAGFEPVQLRSGYGNNDMGAYMGLRDEKVTFFVRRLARGKHSVSYRMRAEIPGKFSALPTKASAMYAPELKANSNEIKLQIKD